LRRLRNRGCETEDIIQQRFKQAENEIKEISWYDYVIFNKDLKKAIRQMIAIYIAEKCKRKRLSDEIRNFNKNFF